MLKWMKNVNYFQIAEVQPQSPPLPPSSSNIKKVVIFAFFHIYFANPFSELQIWF